MKFLIASAAAVFAATFITTSVNADPYTVINKGLYVSGDANVIEVDGGSLNGTSVGLGYRFSRIMEVEVGYFHATIAGGDASIDDAYTDLIGHLYWDSTGRLSLFGSVGADTAIGTVLGIPLVKSSGFRVGGGLDYRLWDRWSVRLGTRYDSAFRNGVNTNLGFTVTF